MPADTANKSSLQIRDIRDLNNPNEYENRLADCPPTSVENTSNRHAEEHPGYIHNFRMGACATRLRVREVAGMQRVRNKIDQRCEESQPVHLDILIILQKVQVTMSRESLQQDGAVAKKIILTKFS